MAKNNYKRPAPNIISTVILGSLAGVTFKVPNVNQNYWLTEEECFERRRRIVHKKHWTKKNHGKTFHFIKRNGEKVRTVFDRSLGFLTEDEFRDVQNKRRKKSSIYKEAPSTSLYSVLSQIDSVIQEEVTPIRSLPAANSHPESRLSNAFPFQAGSIALPSTLFGIRQHQIAEKLDKKDTEEEINTLGRPRIPGTSF